jgi:tetratricopeptide (TPR) repeat protein
MSGRQTTVELFERGRRKVDCLEIDRIIGALDERFGVGEAKPVKVGRYIVEDRLGAGGLGLVYSAFDPVLDRTVAVKVLKREHGSAVREVRLLEEARVLAQLEHPNVVHVFDVGTFDDHGTPRAFVAMELVDGTDLHTWLQQPRSPRAIAEVFMAAAEGLCAVHAAGLLHRDFKPGNVLIGSDGRVRVADFGLAALAEDLVLDPSRTSDGHDDLHTRRWNAVGTPRYMAPEQHQGHALTPQCDQYAFCVSLYEALLDCMPFPDGPDEALLRAKLAGPVFPASPPLPPRLARLLRRGLSPGAEDRYPDMIALREDLRRSQRPSAWPALPFGVVTLAAIGILYAVWPYDNVADCPPRPQPEAATSLPAVEDEDLARMLADVDVALTDYEADVGARWDVLCSLPASQQARAQACLEQCNKAASDLRRALRDGAGEALAQGWSLVESLPDPHVCSTGPASESFAEAMDAAIARAEMHDRMGDFETARSILLALRAEVVDAEVARAEHRVDLQLGRLSFHEGRFEDGVQLLESVYLSADAAGDAQTAAQAATGLVGANAQQGESDAALRWSKMARSQLQRAEPYDVRQEVSLDHNVALAYFEAGELDEALETILAAIRRGDQIAAEEESFDARQLYAEILLRNGRPTEALAVHRQLLRSPRADPRRLPGRHVLGLFGLGNALFTRRELAAACEVFASAHERAVVVLGRDHPTTSSICINHALCAGEQGEAGARERLRPCAAQLKARFGEEHPSVLIARAVEGRLSVAAGEPEAGARVLLDSAARLERVLGRSHYAVVDVVYHVGIAKTAAGDHDGGLRHLVEALEHRRRGLAPGHVDIFESLAQVAVAKEALGRSEEARRSLAEAIAGFESRRIERSYVGMWRDRLARMEGER